MPVKGVYIKDPINGETPPMIWLAATLITAAITVLHIAYKDCAWVETHAEQIPTISY